MKIGDGPSTTDPLRTLRMLDKTHGWALTWGLTILKTEDGGLHWQDVTPAHANLNWGHTNSYFLNDQDAWVATISPDFRAIIVLYTTNGGKSWQSSTAIPTVDTEGPDMTDFVNPSDGWLKIYGEPGASQVPSVIFHTTDGGQHWNELANSLANNATGIFFSDMQNGWALGPIDITADPTDQEAATKPAAYYRWWQHMAIHLLFHRWQVKRYSNCQ